MKLFILESPTKAKTVAKYLGKGWSVVATLGHIRDLPRDSLGVDEETLKPTFFWVKGKKPLMERIKRMASRAQTVYIGTDPDREGEAIAYFVHEELKSLKKPIHRAIFYEITKESILESIKRAGGINLNLVHAQFARRVLDRLIGYKLSPYLWRELKKAGLSIGRVQSPALRLIVEREREIISFKKKELYYVRVLFEKDGVEFYAVWDYAFEKPENAKPFLQKIKDALFEVKEFKKIVEEKEPPKPFITASLQAVASQKLGFSVEKVQSLAQSLYERGYITYPRTDSYRMNEERAREFMEYIAKTYGREYVGSLRKFKTKSTAQGAHECIRPTGIDSPPTQDWAFKLYRLILLRTLASLSSPAKLEQKLAAIIPICKGCESIELTARGGDLLFDGYLKIYQEQVELKRLPELQRGEVLKPVKVELERKQSQPPPRYTEGSLIKKLEHLGIGRPSTYATIVKTLKDRGYVIEERGYLKPTEIAFQVVDYIKEHFSKVVDYEFTARLEALLDLVEEGKEDWKKVVRKSFEDAINL
ncbi:MAG: type I DNA topoisomerase [Acidobacteria bacterium]|nr:MAG: type I DNA topoisomerase [Acidobacteriota bacterium]